MRPTSQSPSAIASSTSMSEPRMSGSFAIQRRSIARWPRGRPWRAGRPRTRRCTRSCPSAGRDCPSSAGRRGPRRWSARRAHALGGAHDRARAAAACSARSPAESDRGRPALARQRFAASTVISMSAGVSSPSAAQPLVELRRRAAAQPQVVARLLGEVLEGLLLAVVGARRVDHQLVRGGAGRGQDHADERRAAPGRAADREVRAACGGTWARAWSRSRSSRLRWHPWSRCRCRSPRCRCPSSRAGPVLELDVALAVLAAGRDANCRAGSQRSGDHKSGGLSHHAH